MANLVSPELLNILSLARPEWKERDLLLVQFKLGKLGITTRADLREALFQTGRNSLNYRLQASGYKAFAGPTLDALARELGLPVLEGSRSARTSTATAASSSSSAFHPSHSVGVGVGVGVGATAGRRSQGGEGYLLASPLPAPPQRAPRALTIAPKSRDANSSVKAAHAAAAPATPMAQLTHSRSQVTYSPLCGERVTSSLHPRTSGSTPERPAWAWGSPGSSTSSSAPVAPYKDFRRPSQAPRASVSPISTWNERRRASVVSHPSAEEAKPALHPARVSSLDKRQGETATSNEDKGPHSKPNPEQDFCCNDNDDDDDEEEVEEEDASNEAVEEVQGAAPHCRRRDPRPSVDRRSVSPMARDFADWLEMKEPLVKLDEGSWDFPLAKSEKRELLLLQIAACEREAVWDATQLRSRQATSTGRFRRELGTGV